jgi:hypothetical protein
MVRKVVTVIFACLLTERNRAETQLRRRHGGRDRNEGSRASRTLVRLDRSNRAACRVDHIVRETIDLCQPDLDRLKLSVSTAIAADLPPVMVDMLQIEHDILRRRHDAIREPH